MFQTHCYDAWLSRSPENSRFAMWSQLGGTFPAPLFLFLAGVAFALSSDRWRDQGYAAGEIAKRTLIRGAQLLALALLFRAQEFALSFRYAHWTDLLRVDILNTIGLSILVMAGVCWLTAPQLGGDKLRLRVAANSGVLASAIVLVTPLLWTRWRPSFLPWPIESYIDGVHNLGQPQAWLFPLFPWAAFALTGLALGCLWMTNSARRSPSVCFFLCGAAGLLLVSAGKYFDSRPIQLYPVYDFWHTSPNFFLIRLGLLLVLVNLAYAWCRWGFGQWGFSPLIQLGNTSLLVYWVHIELVYGRFTILPRHSQTIRGASIGLLSITLAMLALSVARTKWKERDYTSLARITHNSRAAGSAQP
ncbi:MAG: DUF1624 domain-containing protein [Acidobacteria bacterium]|nr:DUF1624 domain-containing protein [Acidobacteriota bacterium]